MGNDKNSFVREVAEKKYEYGFTTNVETDIIEKGLSEDVVRLISRKKGEPDWLLQFRLNAFRYWLTLEQPTWGHLKMPPIDYQAISSYADPTQKRQDNLPRETPRERHHLLLHQRGCPRASRLGARVLGQRRSLQRQFLRSTQLRSLQRRLIRLYPKRCALSDGTQHILPHQCPRYRSVRADAHRLRRRCLRLIPRRLHGSYARREPAPRRHRRDCGEGAGRSQVLDGAELVSRR